jgi:NAD(P)-dependent dehydrogenase (short-subunit alcohol dehydrogenase family)
VGNITEYDHRRKYRDRKGNRQGVFLLRDIAVRRSNLFVQELLKHNAKVYLAARNATKANTAIAELPVEDETRTGKDTIFLQLDLADLTAARKSAEEFLSCVLSLCLDQVFADYFVRKKSQLHLHILINDT